VIEKIFKFVISTTVLLFSIATFQGSLTTVSASSTHMELTVNVSEKGFFDEKGKLLGPKNPLKVPKGKKITIIFVFEEALNSLAIGDVHQIAITADDGWTMESDKIWVFNRKSTVTFVPGESGRKQYRAYCTVDCIGMDHLNNLVIRVVGLGSWQQTIGPVGN
jgi:hypothetical protein